MVTFLIFDKKMVEVEGVIKEAETKLPPSKAPLALGTVLREDGSSLRRRIDAAEMKRWNDAARSWYEKAQATDPADLSIKRRLTDFLLQSKQTDEAQKYLEAIRTQGGGAKNAETTAWANRALALVLANGTDRTQLTKALAIFEPDGKPVTQAKKARSSSARTSVIRKTCGFLLEFSTCKEPMFIAKERLRSWKLWPTRI